MTTATMNTILTALTNQTQRRFNSTEDALQQFGEETHRIIDDLIIRQIDKLHLTNAQWNKVKCNIGSVQTLINTDCGIDPEEKEKSITELTNLHRIIRTALDHDHDKAASLIMNVVILENDSIKYSTLDNLQNASTENIDEVYDDEIKKVTEVINQYSELINQFANSLNG